MQLFWAIVLTFIVTVGLVYALQSRYLSVDISRSKASEPAGTGPSTTITVTDFFDWAAWTFGVNVSGYSNSGGGYGGGDEFLIEGDPNR